MEKRIGKNQKIDSEPIYPDVAGNAATVPMAGLEKFYRSEEERYKAAITICKEIVAENHELVYEPAILAEEIRNRAQVESVIGILVVLAVAEYK